MPFKNTLNIGFFLILIHFEFPINLQMKQNPIRKARKNARSRVTIRPTRDLGVWWHHKRRSHPQCDIDSFPTGTDTFHGSTQHKEASFRDCCQELLSPVSRCQPERCLCSLTLCRSLSSSHSQPSTEISNCHVSKSTGSRGSRCTLRHGMRKPETKDEFYANSCRHRNSGIGIW